MFNKNLDQTKKKVYVNPNFTRPPGTQPTSSGMYVNPKFTHLLTNVQSNHQNKPKIYLNPDFMRSRSSAAIYQTPNTNYVQQETLTNHAISLHYSGRLELEKETLAAPVPISTSRYSIVRQNVTKVPERPLPVVKPKTTIQINKYKSIPLTDIKKSLDNTKNKLVITQLSTTSSNSKNLCSSSPNISRKNFKLVNQSAKSHIVNNKIKIRMLNETHRKMLLAKLKLQKPHLKKNNIPCSMFKKFGKCVRNNCEFLHDKKQVSICRNFVKGLCHNSDCLLSHDLTTKKMPTCYFYLQGKCTKPDCPYLHVKLSDKVKICPDFVKGYCEKGDTCLLRHVNIQEQKRRDAKKGKSVLWVKPKKSHVKKKMNNSKDKKILPINAETTQNVANTVNLDKSENNTDYRYYQESQSDLNISESCASIKPTRCKLGTLPSFIQL